jgi:hypothetical protein
MTPKSPIFRSRQHVPVREFEQPIDGATEIRASALVATAGALRPTSGG